jgi:hypothetical protein
VLPGLCPAYRGNTAGRVTHPVTRPRNRTRTGR